MTAAARTLAAGGHALVADVIEKHGEVVQERTGRQLVECLPAQAGFVFRGKFDFQGAFWEKDSDHARGVSPRAAAPPSTPGSSAARRAWSSAGQTPPPAPAACPRPARSPTARSAL